MDIYTLIFLVLAVVIFWKLRSVLGQRTGNERPPFDPFSRRGNDAQGAGGKTIDAQPTEVRPGDKVVPLPRRAEDGTVIATADPAAERIAAYAPAGSPLAAGLAAVASADRSFDPAQFLDGARTAYEMIVTAFANGDRKALNPLLSKEVYDGFVAAIDEREKRGESVRSTFVGIDKAEIAAAGMKGSEAQVTMHILSQMISATFDKESKLIDGDPDNVVEIKDLWTFARDTRSRDPNWKLVATEAED